MATYIPGVTDIFPEPSLFTPDFSFMDKMLQRKQSMYEQGFAQVNSKYNLINKEVTNPQNLTVRDNFLKQAKLNLKDLSALDLSEQQNVMSAISVFEPFAKNTNVIGDQALTEHWNNQESIAESFRLKDGGKEFSEDNINYVRLQKQAFAKDSPNSWNNYYQSRRSYTPYYDVDKEIAEAMKNFKPDDVEYPTFSGMYIFSTKDASVKPEAVRRYLDGVLSDKAKEQMKISAAVRYGSTPEQLASPYKQSVQQTLKSIDNDINKIQLSIKTQKDPNTKAALVKQLSGLEDLKSDYNEDLTRINNGDYSFLKGKAEQVAYNIYYNQKINEKANAYARKEYKQTVTANTVALDMWKDGQIWARQKDQQEFEKQKEQGLFSGALVTAIIPPTEDDIKTRGMGNLVTEYDAVRAKSSEISKDINNYILRYYRNDGVTDKNDNLTLDDLVKNPDVVSKFISSHKDLPDVANYVAQTNMYAQQLQTITQMVSKAKSEITKSLTPEQKNAITNYVTQSKGVGDIVFTERGKQIRYGADQIAQGIVDGTVKTRFVGDLAIVSINGQEYALNRKSKNASTQSAIQNLNAVINLASQNNSLKPVLEAYNNAMNKYFTTEFVQNDVVQVYGDESKPAKLLSSYIQGFIPLAEGTISITGIKTSPTTNRTYFNVAASDKAKIKTKTGDIESITEDNLIPMLQAQGLKVGKSSVGGYYIENSQLALNSAYRNYTPMETWMAQHDQYMGNASASTFWYPLGKQIHTDPKTKKSYRLPAFKYEKNIVTDFTGNKKSVYYLYDDAGGPFLKQYDNLHDLITDAKSLSTDLSSYIRIKQSTLR